MKPRVRKNHPEQGIYLFSPGGAVMPEDFTRGIAILDEFGLKYRQDPYCLTHAPDWEYLAGTDKQRAEAIREAFIGNYNAVMAVRGGYGTLRAALLALSGLVVPVPLPVVMGFSDVTVLHALLNSRGLISFHGPNLTGLASTDRHTIQKTASVLSGRAGRPDLSLSTLRALTGNGIIHARLLGGNLSVWCSMLGTGLLPDARDAILLLEDTGEPAYRIDRMLLQLRLAMASNPPAAVVFGQVSDENNDIEFILRSFARDIGVPVAVGAPVGHGGLNHPLALNAMYSLDINQGQLNLLEDVYED